MAALTEQAKAINNQTGFANGERFTSEEQVREYFTAAEQRIMFNEDAITDEAKLSGWAEMVIESRWHCAF